MSLINLKWVPGRNRKTHSVDSSEVELRDEASIFSGIVKWSLLSVVVGSLVGAVGAVFLWALRWGCDLRESGPWFLLCLPFTMAAGAWLIRTYAPESKGFEGTEKVIEAVNDGGGGGARTLPAKLLATLLTVCGGGSVGKEGPCAQIGAGIGAMASSALRLTPADHRKLMASGAAAGFAVVFGSPLGGALFAAEVLSVGIISYEILLPSLVGALASHGVAVALGSVCFESSLRIVPVMSDLTILTALGSGLWMGACSLIMIVTLKLGGRLRSLMGLGDLQSAFVGGLLVVILAVAVSRHCLGLGEEVIVSTLAGASVQPWEPLLKMVSTSLTLGFGGSGGTVTPIFYVGSTAGSVYADVFGLDRATFAALGFSAMLAGCANTPIAAAVMALEFFDPAVAPYAAVACVVAFLVSGRHSVFSSQIFGFAKSDGERQFVGKPVGGK